MHSQMSIPEFFTGKSVFITGGSGFIGKLLIEKLLRSCPEIARVFVLLRPRKGCDAKKRLEKILELPLFSILKIQQEGQLKKIIAVEGDVTHVGLGMSEADRTVIQREVQVVFHAAASVRFDEPLKKACLMNTRGIVEVAKLCKELHNLAVLMHVSTTYCNTHQAVISEKVYPAPMSWRKLIQLCETNDDSTLDVLTPKILGAYPNTYTFTKALAENAVQDLCRGLPVVIFRPSIVIPTMEEPVPGWVDNLNGPMALMIGAGKGVLRTFLVDPKVKSDLIPADYVVRALIAATWDQAVSFQTSRGSQAVFNCSSTEAQSFSQSDIHDLGFSIVLEYPLGDTVWHPATHLVTSRTLFMIYFFFMQLIPAVFIDAVLHICKKKPILMQIQRKIFVACLALEYFTSNEWYFKNDKLNALEARVFDEDKTAFQFGLRGLTEEDKKQYFINATIGANIYLFNRPANKLDDDRKHFNRMYWLDRMVKLIFVASALYASIKFRLLHDAFDAATDVYTKTLLLLQDLLQEP